MYCLGKFQNLILETTNTSTSLDLSTTQHWNVLCGQSSYKFALFRHRTPGMTTCRWHSLRITQGTPGLNSHRLNYNSIDDSENYLSCRHGSARWSATLPFAYIFDKITALQPIYSHYTQSDYMVWWQVDRIYDFEYN